MPNDRLLAIYLDDHFAASTAGRNRCRYARDQNAGEQLGAVLDSLLHEIEEDRATLRHVMTRVGVEPSRLRAAGGAALERVGRFKLNGQLTGYSPLSRVVDLEALTLGVTGKALLWAALRELRDERLAGFDFEALEARAVSQRQRLEEQRRLATANALA